MTAETGQYRYPELRKPRSTRVFHLDPSSSHHTQLRGSLFEIDLSSAEVSPYWALSYSWDAEIPTVPILVRSTNTIDISNEQEGGIGALQDPGTNYGVLRVTSNCAAALFQFRDDTDPRALWVDSICINQTALDEKNSQVAKMADIYKSAERVIVWLGSKDEETVKGLQFLKQPVVPPPQVVRLNMDWDQFRREIFEKVRDLVKNVHSFEDDPLGPLFSRSWFQRMWTVQEIALPQEHRVHVFCGDENVAFLNMLAMLDLLEQIKYRWSRAPEIMSLPRYLVKALKAQRDPGIRELLKTATPAFDLDNGNEHLLMKSLLFCRTRLATEPKDKYFAMYGILSELGLRTDPPDYRKRIELVYAEATKACIEYDNSIEVLCYLISETRTPHLPSWVLDLSSEGLSESDARGPIVGGQYAAAGGSEDRFIFPDNPLHLRVFGKIIDCIRQKTQAVDLAPYDLGLRYGQQPKVENILSPDRIAALGSQISVFRQWVKLAGESGSSTYPTGESMMEALRRTLVFDNPESNAQTVDNFEPWYKYMSISLLASLNEASNRTTVAPSSSTTNSSSLLPTSSDEQISSGSQRQTVFALFRSGGWAFHSLALSFSRKRSFFLTETGYFGTAPDMIPDPIRKDDRVALIAGLSAPVLLRKASEGYRMISQCYLHGCMYGEAWPEDERLLEEITLV